MRWFIISIVLFWGPVGSAFGCTTFILQDSVNLLFGRNYDYDLGTGFLVLNKRRLEKQAIVPSPHSPARWISRYGSVTFNQVGIDAPMGGMNEKGLVIAQMALPETVYPEYSGKPVVNQLEWIQYQLDISASLNEVIEHSQRIAIVPVATPVHYLICDRQGNVGIIEFLSGKQIIRQEREITVPVCSNMPYDQAKEALRQYRGLGGQKIIPKQWKSIADIIAIAAVKVNQFTHLKDHNAVDYGFEILSALGSPERTQWSVVYDIKNKSIYFRSRNNKKVRRIDLNDRDYSCNRNITVVDIQDSHSKDGYAVPFMILTKDAYYDYKKNLMEWFKTHLYGFPNIPDEAIAEEVEYVFNRRCK